MKHKIFWTLALSWLGLGITFAQPGKTQDAAGYTSKVWVSDLGNGSYKNPILYADYSDPDVIRVGDDFYMTSSSFNCSPGLPILHSKDLVNWSIISHALPKQYPLERYTLPRHGDGCWAPCLRFHGDTYYIYWGDPDYGIYVVHTKDPAGVWSVPTLVLEGKGLIDPSPLWDDDGKVWLVHGWAGSRAGVNSLLTVNRLSDDGLQALDDGKHVFDGHDAHPTIEGPKFYKRNGYYYIFAPAGGVSTGWQLALRSRDIYGPYEEKIVLEQGLSSINGPHQGAWIDTPRGDSWFIHFQDQEAYGRIVHLQPMEWKNDWPYIGQDMDGDGIGEPVLTHKKPDTGKTSAICTPLESDEFDTDALGLQWQWHANPQVTWSALMRGSGFLRLFSIAQPTKTENLWETPNLLLQKFPASSFTATTKIKWVVGQDEAKGRRAGLLIMGNDYAGLVISNEDNKYMLSQISCKNARAGKPETVVATQQIPQNSVYLQVRVQGPDARCQFYYALDGQHFMPIGETFLAQPDTWIGAKVGIFSSSLFGAKRGGYADFDWFRVH